MIVCALVHPRTCGQSVLFAAAAAAQDSRWVGGRSRAPAERGGAKAAIKYDHMAVLILRTEHSESLSKS